MAIDPITALLDIGGKVIDRVFPDPLQAAQAKLEMFKLQQSGDLAQMTGQMEIDKVEAASTNWFVAGGRPFIMWVCGAACSWNWVGLPMAKFACSYFGHPVNLAPADVSEMMPVMMGILGLGAYRSFEKVKGVEGNR